MSDTSKEAVRRLSMDCKRAADVLHDAGSFETGQGILLDARSAMEALCAELDEAKAEIKRRHNAQSYTYIGKDGKSVQARDLEDERDALKAEIERLREYAQHKRSCDLMGAFIDGKFCTCGFSAKMKGTSDD